MQIIYSDTHNQTVVCTVLCQSAIYNLGCKVRIDAINTCVLQRLRHIMQCALKLANVDLGYWNVMAYPSLFLYFFHQLVSWSPSLLVLVENIFTYNLALVINLMFVCCQTTHESYSYIQQATELHTAVRHIYMQIMRQYVYIKIMIQVLIARASIYACLQHI